MITPGQIEKLEARIRERFPDFSDFQSPGADFVARETGYKRTLLKRFREELGAEKLARGISEGQGLTAVKDIARVLSSNIVSFHSWSSLGKTDQEACAILRECLSAASAPYAGPASTAALFETAARLNLKLEWDALSMLLWALRPEDFFPIKISYYRELAANSDSHFLPVARAPKNYTPLSNSAGPSARR